MKKSSECKKADKNLPAFLKELQVFKLNQRLDFGKRLA